VAIQRRTVICLAEPKWLHIPFLGSSKTELERLHDLALRIPALLSRTTSIVQHRRLHHFAGRECGTNTPTEPCPSTFILDLIENYECLLSEMEAWFDDLEQRHLGPLYWHTEVNSEITSQSALLEVDPQCIPVFNTTLCRVNFPNGQIAGVLANYWSYQLDLLLGLMEVEQNIIALSCENTKFGQRHSLAREKVFLILETMPYLKSCFEGSIRTHAPMKRVNRYFAMVKGEA
jgi:hypothetical protein